MRTLPVQEPPEALSAAPCAQVLHIPVILRLTSPLLCRFDGDASIALASDAKVHLDVEPEIRSLE